MTDIHSKETRSYNMSRIKGTNTKPEIIVRKYLFSKGLRFRIHTKNLPGKPDIVLPKYKTVVFVHGCFWHGHENCKYFVIPKTKTEWWLKKIQGNCTNDTKNYKILREHGWKIITVWECDLKKSKQASTLQNIYNLIKFNEQ